MISTIFKIAIVSFVSVFIYKNFFVGKDKNFHDKCLVAMMDKGKSNEKIPCIFCKKKYHYDKNVSFKLPPINF
jgi:hypothetical protein